MKRIFAMILVLTMAVSLAGCCNHKWEEATCESPRICNNCNTTEGEPLGHTPRGEVISAVDTQTLTITFDTVCDRCGEVIETRQTPTGIAPANSVIAVSAEEWYSCLLTNIKSYGAGQSLYSYPVESDDNALLHSVVSMSQMNAVFSYRDSESNVITTDKGEVRSSIHNIRMDAQFTNDNAKEFFMLLMILAINNNSDLTPEAANALASQVMSGYPVTDNGYTYAMEIISAEDHIVCVSITAE